MGTKVTQQGYYSILRWRRDVTRDEARNVAVILVDASGRCGGLKSAPVSSISPRLQDQGILDALLVGLEQRFKQENMLTVEDLRKLHTTLERSLFLTEPVPAAITNFEQTLSALYKALVSPRGHGSRALTKGKVLDQVLKGFRAWGMPARRGVYLGDFIFDAVVDGPEPAVVEVLSFATEQKNWQPVEKDAGHFLFALDHVDRPGIAVVQPPTNRDDDRAKFAHERVLKWLDRPRVRITAPEQFTAPSLNARELAHAQ